MKYTSEQFDEGYNKLPESVQDFVMSDDVAESIDMIAEEFGIIDETKSEEFILDVFALVVGIGSIDTFVEELHSVFGLPEERVDDLLIDISELVLEPASYLLDEASTTSTNPPLATPPRYTTSIPTSSPSSSFSSPSQFRPQANPIPLKKPDVGPSSEHPVPLIPKPFVPAATQSQPTNTPQFKSPAPAPMTPPQQAPAPAQQEKPSIMNTRLTSSTIVPAEEIVIGSAKPEEMKNPTYNDADPYRESPTA